MTRPQHDSYSADGCTVSSDAFYAIACDPARHVVVEACAGAGKTWMLVSRILRALLAGAEPQQILAITFTKKAAAEMRQRLNEWLAAFADSPLDQLARELELRGLAPAQAQEQAPHLRALYLRLLQHGRSTQIRTFHSWFAALLRAAPLQVLQQLGLPGQYELLEDDQHVAAEVWRPFYQALLSDPSAMADYQALVLRNGRSNTHKALEAALAKRVEFMLADGGKRSVVEASVPSFDVVFPDMQGAEDPVQALLQGESSRAVLLEAARVLAQAKAKTFAAKGVELEQAVTGNDWDGVWSALFTDKGTPRKFGSNSADIDTVFAAQERVERTRQALLQQEGRLYHLRMMRLTRVLLACHSEVKRQQGWVDMSDIERAARVLLEDRVLSGWIQERLDAQLRHLLVDEFQDTNPMQWQALHAWLAGYVGAAVAPSVFIVGDPKQSIYRFRRADPQVFRAAKEFVRTGLGGSILSCDHTRRNSQPVVDAVNAVMLAVQAQDGYEGFRSHTTASQAPGCVLALPRIARPEPIPADVPDGWRDALTTPKETEEEALSERECRQAARWLLQCVQAGTSPDDILVIARTNDRIATMQAALAEVGLPAQKVEKMLLADAPEVQDIVALVDALISPRHDLSLARALKSPIFGLGDEALIRIVQGVREAALRLAAEAPVRISWLDWLLTHAGQPESPWQALALTLKSWQQWLQQGLPHDALDAIYRDGDILARYRASTPATLRAGVTERLLALPGHTLALDGGRYASAYRWVRALRGSDGTKAPVAAGQGIRLLTIHGAKGLEAGVVLLLDTDASQRRSKTMDVLVRWPGEKTQPDSFIFLEKFSVPPPSAQTVLAEDVAAEEREAANALYVAMTRAAQVLAFSSAEPYQPQPDSWWQLWVQHAAPQMLALEGDGKLAPPAQGWPAIASRTSDSGVQVPAVRAGDDWLVLPQLADGLRNRSTATVQALQGDAEARLQANLGEAMHKALEWYRPDAAAQQREQLRQALASRYVLSSEQVEEVLCRADAIVQGEGGWIWDDAQIDWWANEIDLAVEGTVARLDRLVHRRTQGAEPGSWWVLDFKSSWTPQEQDALRGQLQAYRAAVQRLYPGESVQAAFLTAEGRMLVL